MRWQKRIRRTDEGVNLAADIQAVIAVNRGRPGTSQRIDAASVVAVVQDSRRAPAAGEEPEPNPKEHA
jgi:hypothetical protein